MLPDSAVGQVEMQGACGIGLVTDVMTPRHYLRALDPKTCRFCKAGLGLDSPSGRGHDDLPADEAFS